MRRSGSDDKEQINWFGMFSTLARIGERVPSGTPLSGHFRNVAGHLQKMPGVNILPESAARDYEN
jgi:hypothetical protein